jgi:hypothetical protein
VETAEAGAAWATPVKAGSISSALLSAAATMCLAREIIKRLS